MAGSSLLFLNVKSHPQKGSAARTPMIPLTVINRIDVCISWQRMGGGGAVVYTLESYGTLLTCTVSWHNRLGGAPSP